MSRPMIGSAASTPRATAGARDDAERDEAVDAGVVAVGDEGRAREASACAQPDLRGDLVADEADQPGKREHPGAELLGWIKRWIDS